MGGANVDVFMEVPWHITLFRMPILTTTLLRAVWMWQTQQKWKERTKYSEVVLVQTLSPKPFMNWD